MAGSWYGGTPPGITGSYYGGDPFGKRGAEVKLPGLGGPSLLGPDVDSPADDERLFRCVVLLVPPGLTFFSIDEWSRLEFEGPDGTHVGSKQGYVDGAAYGGATAFTLQIGGGNSVLTGTLDAEGGSLGGGFSSASPAPSAITGTMDLGSIGVSGGVAGGGPARPIYPPGFHPRLRRTIRLTVPDPQEVPDLSPIAPGDTITLEFDMRPYASVTSPQLDVARAGGDDGLPGVATTGSPVVVDGSYVLQRFTADLTALGSTYELSCTVTDTETGDTITATGRLPVCI